MGRCPVLDRLVGSRLLASNAELRLEMHGSLGLIPHTRRIPPVQTALFYDVGEAWTQNQDPGPALAFPTMKAPSPSLRFTVAHDEVIFDAKNPRHFSRTCLCELLVHLTVHDAI